MEIPEIKQKLIDIFGEQLEFNKDFIKYSSKLKEGMLHDLIDWCVRCKENRELGSVPKNKKFKNIYVFFRKIASDVRAVLIREKNGSFKIIILDNHKTYDDTRKSLGYKKSSYYGS